MKMKALTRAPRPQPPSRSCRVGERPPPPHTRQPPPRRPACHRSCPRPPPPRRRPAAIAASVTAAATLEPRHHRLHRRPRRHTALSSPPPPSLLPSPPPTTPPPPSLPPCRPQVRHVRALYSIFLVRTQKYDDTVPRLALAARKQGWWTARQSPPLINKHPAQRVDHTLHRVPCVCTASPVCTYVLLA